MQLQEALARHKGIVQSLSTSRRTSCTSDTGLLVSRLSAFSPFWSSFIPDLLAIWAHLGCVTSSSFSHPSFIAQVYETSCSHPPSLADFLISSFCQAKLFPVFVYSSNSWSSVVIIIEVCQRECANPNPPFAQIDCHHRFFVCYYVRSTK